MPGFLIIPGDPPSTVLVHVPHASRTIPAEVRADLVLDDAALALELDRMTDARTDELTTAAADACSLRPWLMINQLSRLVVDPERFPDEREEMRAVGMGAVYTATSQRQPLRRSDPVRDGALIREHFVPYATAMTELTAERIAATGTVTIIDLHSYPSQALPYELHVDLRRPAVCLGDDPVHTHSSVLETARAAFAGVGEVLINEPFLGSYVPERFIGVETRVQSIMVELRRDSYLDEDTGTPGPRWTDVVTALTRMINSVA